MAIATLISLATEPLAIAKSVVNEDVTDKTKERAELLIDLIRVNQTPGFDFWEKIEETLEY